MTPIFRAAITGLGAVSPYGAGAELFWSKLAAGETAFSEIDVFDATPFRNTKGGVVRNFTPEPSLPRADAFLFAAVKEAVAEAKLTDIPASEVGIVLGTNFGPAGEMLAALASGGAVRTFASGLAAARKAFPAQGEAETLSLTCASGGAALGRALQLLRLGRFQAVIAGGYDELSLHCYAGLSNLRAITKDAVRPFDARRSGTLFAEGAGVLVLEREDSASKRGAKARGYLRGWAVNNDAFHLTAPDKTAAGISSVMRSALADAGVQPEEVSLVNCHATATPYNDANETRALKNVFGAHAYKLRVSANKSAFGHAMGAAGALEGIATVRSLEAGLAPPTLGLEEPDPELDLDYCPGAAKPGDYRLALSSNYGLGGANAALIFEKA